MATEWFLDDGSDVLVHIEDPQLLLIGRGLPDWVKSPPETPDIGARTFKVRAHSQRICVKCRIELVVELVLDDGYRVSFCPTCKFVWYHVRMP